MLTLSARRVALLASVLALAACADQADQPAVATAPLSARVTVDESVRSLTARGEETVLRTAGPTPGSTMTTIVSGNAEVVLARKNADGTQTQRCVGSAAEAFAFTNAAPTVKAADQ
jgi:hypothetical protein